MNTQPRSGGDAESLDRPGIGRARIRAAAASGLCETLRSRGAEAHRILQRLRLSEEQLERPAEWLKLSDYCQLFEDVALELAAPMFGLTFGLERWSAVLGDLDPLATSAPTLLAAFHALGEAMPAHQEQSSLSVIRHGSHCHVGYRIRDGHIIRRRQDAELTLGVLIGFVRAQLGPEWAPAEVHFDHPCGDPVRGYDSLLGTPVYFGQRRTALVMTLQDAGTALPGADSVAFSRAGQRLAERLLHQGGEDFVGLVLAEMRDGMAAGEAGIETVARRLGLSGPALYRRLKASGAEFSVLRRDLRRRIALMHVADPAIPLTEVAMLLGYSELSAFSRAFRSWTGVAAIDYRRRREERTPAVAGADVARPLVH